MPVVGHAFAGLAAAIEFGPAAARDHRQPGPAASFWWTPALVAASYFPDIVTQIGGVFGVSYANYYGHVPAVGLAAGVVLGSVWSALAGTSVARAAALFAACILGHDLLDVIQPSDWPWQGRIVPYGLFGLSARIVSDAALSLALFAVFLAWRKWKAGSAGAPAAGIFDRPALARWMSAAIVAAMLVAAVGTYLLRAGHERQINAARRLLESGRYIEALLMADEADRWPHGNRPGRIDVIRGEAHQRLGHWELAERLFIRAYEEDPTNFWALADLAECYARSARPPRERRRLAEARTKELRLRFPTHPGLHNVLEGIERELSRADAAE